MNELVVDDVVVGGGSRRQREDLRSLGGRYSASSTSGTSGNSSSLSPRVAVRRRVFLTESSKSPLVLLVTRPSLAGAKKAAKVTSHGSS